MKEITDEACELFLSKITVCFEDALFEKFERLYNNKTDKVSYQLQSPPKLEFSLKCGFLLKRGGQVKNWKRRHFEALNESENYNIAYYKQYKGKMVRKGVINCNGYRVEMFLEEEEEVFGQFGFKLVPYDERRRCWWFRAEDEDDKKEWEEIFSNACRKSQPSRHHIPLIETAFDRAFHSVRYSYGYFNPIEVCGTEEEMLFDFIGGEILHRELLHDAFSSIPSRPDKASQVQEIKHIANKIVGKAVKATWKSALEGLMPLIPPAFLPQGGKQTQSESTSTCSSDEHDISEFLKQQYGEVYFNKFVNTIQVQAEIQSKVCAAAASVVDPVILDAAQTTCVPLLEAITDSVAQAYAEAVEGFASDVQHTVLVSAKLSRETGSGEHAEALANAHRRVNVGYNSGPLKESRMTLWAMYTNNLNQPDVQQCFSNGALNAYDIYSRISDNIAALTHSAIYTYGKLTIEGDMDPESALSSCKDMASADSKLRQQEVLVDILNRLVDPVVQEMIVIPCCDVIQQMQILVPPHMRDDFSIQSCGDRLIADMVDRVLASLVKQFLSKSYSTSHEISSYSPVEVTVV